MNENRYISWYGRYSASSEHLSPYIKMHLLPLHLPWIFHLMWSYHENAISDLFFKEITFDSFCHPLTNMIMYFDISHPTPTPKRIYWKMKYLYLKQFHLNRAMLINFLTSFLFIVFPLYWPQMRYKRTNPYTNVENRYLVLISACALPPAYTMPIFEFLMFASVNIWLFQFYFLPQV